MSYHVFKRNEGEFLNIFDWLKYINKLETVFFTETIFNIRIFTASWFPNFTTNQCHLTGSTSILQLYQNFSSLNLNQFHTLFLWLWWWLQTKTKKDLQVNLPVLTSLTPKDWKKKMQRNTLMIIPYLKKFNLLNIQHKIPRKKKYRKIYSSYDLSYYTIKKSLILLVILLRSFPLDYVSAHFLHFRIRFLRKQELH